MGEGVSVGIMAVAAVEIGPGAGWQPAIKPKTRLAASAQAQICLRNGVF
jgi:hypothetical protein